MTLLSLDIQRHKIRSVAVVSLQFYRELEHLDQNQAVFNALHYPALAEALQLVQSHHNTEIAFILSDRNDNYPVGSHWTACVLNVAKREYRYGDSAGSDPPPWLRQRLEIWLNWAQILNRGENLERGPDLEHNLQQDSWSCGFVAANMLERYVFQDATRLWSPENDATLRVIKYINMMEFNGTDRGSPVSIIDDRYIFVRKLTRP